MLTLEFTATGKTHYDLKLALEEAIKHADNEIRYGANGNEDGDYTYSVSGKEELEEQNN